LIWGGRRVCLARIVFLPESQTSHSRPLHLAISPEIEAADWIFDACFGIPKKDSEIEAYFVTAHNHLYALLLDDSQSVNFSLSQIGCGLNSILYSAHIRPLSPGAILIAAGTVFGEVVVWSCSEDASHVADGQSNWRSNTHHVFAGHNGSIFGICLSDPLALHDDRGPGRLLASCSDDRTIRIWEVSDGKPTVGMDPEAAEVYSETKQQTGFGGSLSALDKDSIASTWAHLSRIWGVEFWRQRNDLTSLPLHLISRGEDATLHFWSLAIENSISRSDTSCLPRGALAFKHVGCDRSHSGKHIWSLSHRWSPSAMIIHTGGGDGRIVARKSSPSPSEAAYLSIATPFTTIWSSQYNGENISDTRRRRDSDAIKQYVFVGNTTILATTNHGQVVTGTVDVRQPPSSMSLGINWSLVLQAQELRGYAVVSSDVSTEIAYIGSATGEVWMYRHELRRIQLLMNVDQKISSIFAGKSYVQEDGGEVRILLLYLHSSDSMKLIHFGTSCQQKRLEVLQTVNLKLPSTFQPTACLVICDGNRLILGSRSGAIAIYDDISGRSEILNIAAPVACIRHVHGSDTVTCLQDVPGTPNDERNRHSSDILSTGRDGSYAIHRIMWNTYNGSSACPEMTTLHRSCPPFGPNIEGGHIDVKNPASADLILHGFHAKDFVVWNESKHTEVIRIPCGGAHRSWTYVPNFCNEQQEEIKQGGCFVWTKASVFNMARWDSPAQTIVQPGGHGREIKAMALHSGSFSDESRGITNARFVATGAEDTAIRLWAVTPTHKDTPTNSNSATSENDAICLRIMNKHTAGIQHLAFCEDFLFSSAGCEELFIWKINFGVWGFGVGTVFQAALPKEAEVSDLRITSFEVVYDADCRQPSSGSATQRFLIYAAYSNSMVKTFRYTNDGLLVPEDRFELLRRGSYNTTCLMQLSMIPNLSSFLTASTNGSIAIWPQAEIASDESDQCPELDHIAEHHIHQNAITALEIIELTPNCSLLFTGGDDNALGMTILEHSTDQSMPRFGTLLIPRAHAAAITAVGILDVRKSIGQIFCILATASNDQRLKIWRIRVNVRELWEVSRDLSIDAEAFRPRSVRAIEVQLVHERWTSVADVSSMIVIPDGNDTGSKGGEAEGIKAPSKAIMIAGIGMEMIRISMTDNAETDIN
jgi:WD repeat-containing protein 6